ncbi:MAG: DUF3182 family protein [Burkholderiales bacterium]|nr:DUF3182 family protein [Burkholderiales bacterium]
MNSLSAAAADFSSGIPFPTSDAPAGTTARAEPGVVMPYTEGMRGFACEHELMTRLEVVRRLAQLKGLRHSAEKPLAAAHEPVYYVPSDTLVGLERAQALGIHNRDHLFGGVVPQAFVATKAITHALVEEGAHAPEGWCTEFADRVGDAVLKGFTAFGFADARRAGRLLLAEGPVRVKTVRETGGRGQTVVRSEEELDACLASFDAAALEQDGVVLEENLTDVITLSVGQVTVAGMVASYHGEQYLTRNREGGLAYGGSRLTVVRGDFNALLALPLADDVRLGVEQAMTYDAAAIACFPGFFASRINYDVVQGIDARGQWRSGVLEQSWRAGGATGAEIAALEAFRADAQRELVTAACVEVHGPCELPDGAVVYFQGDDPATGPLTKYTLVETNAHAS